MEISNGIVQLCEPNSLIRKISDLTLDLYLNLKCYSYLFASDSQLTPGSLLPLTSKPTKTI